MRKATGVVGAALFMLSFVAPGHSQTGVIYEGCPPRCEHGAVPDDYGCPGYVPVRLKPPTGEGSKELLADRAVSLITSKCDTSSLVGGLTTDLEATLSIATSPVDHQAA